MDDVGRLDSKTNRLRMFVESMGEYGASAREMQRVLWYMNRDEVRMRWVIDKENGHHAVRGAKYSEVADLVVTGGVFMDVPSGYWCTNLYGTGTRVGFLTKNCVKNVHGRWALKPILH